MDSLNGALFGEHNDGTWSQDDLSRLAAIGGRWREASRLYPASPYVAPLKTMLSEKVVLILDPVNGATLADALNTELYTRVSEEQLKQLWPWFQTSRSAISHLYDCAYKKTC